MGHNNPVIVVWGSGCQLGGNGRNCKTKNVNYATNCKGKHMIAKVEA